MHAQKEGCWGGVPAVNKPGRKEDDDAHHLEGICWGLHVIFFFSIVILYFHQAQVCLGRNHQLSH